MHGRCTHVQLSLGNLRSRAMRQLYLLVQISACVSRCTLTYVEYFNTRTKLNIYQNKSTFLSVNYLLFFNTFCVTNLSRTASNSRGLKQRWLTGGLCPYFPDDSAIPSTASISLLSRPQYSYIRINCSLYSSC